MLSVLAALAGEEKGDLAGLRAAAAEDALGLQRFPGLRIVEAGGLLCFGQLFGQFMRGRRSR